MIGAAVVKTFHADGSAFGKVIRPFPTVFSIGARVAIYEPNPETGPLLAIGSGAGLRSTVAFYQADGEAAGALRVFGGKLTRAVSVSAVAADEYHPAALIVAAEAYPKLEVRLTSDALPTVIRPFPFATPGGLNVG
jgi:hypothetical protein